ncbi:sulfotransferase family protein [Gluconacetobacter sacchari]|uniref:Sulfotransferase family protein n=2 Tax=Gluconacetobacter sacchari TaxID=92759 RepID=A0A7W4NQH2_9PROT|nr:hypothetical protein [Gluconacetobacter sacchari]MBB2159988.1 hypothetical protein [Gluconacetobacter sacchari]
MRRRGARPIFMLHIPKTAGSSVNVLMSGLADSVAHLESKPALKAMIAEGSVDVDYASGHVYLDDMRHLTKGRNWFTFTILREPIAQTVSHIKWVKSFGAPSRMVSWRGYSPGECRLFRALYGTDLDDVDKLGYIFRRNELAAHFFDNCQTRYLAGRRDRPLRESDYRDAIAGLASLDHVGLCERVEDTLSAVLQSAGWGALPVPVPRTNQARIQGGPDLDDPRVWSFYANLTRFDRRLYDHCRILEGAA